MSALIYKLTREIAYIILIFLSIYLLKQLEIERFLMNLILTIMFLYISHKYEKKYKAVTVGYAFLFLVIFIINSVAPCYYNQAMIDELNVTLEHGWWAGDYYYLYFIIDLLCYLIIIFYLQVLCQKITIKNFNVNLNKNQFKNYVLGCLLMFVIYLISDGNFEYLIPCFVFLAIMVIYQKKYKIISLLLLLAFIFLGGYKIIQIRFELIEVVLKVMNGKNIKKCSLKSFIVANIILACLLFLIGFYGVVSEVYKLNHFWGGNYSLKDILFSKDDFMYYFEKQGYRLFLIWTKLGGYIIYHVQNNGFYYGITYFKSLSNLLGFDYVSLPVISAIYNGSTYAQPGLLAEGYANFGIFGAIINICIVFFLMEYLTRIFLRKPSINTLILCVVPFSKILLDGGSLNSALVLIIISLIFCIFTIRIPIRKNQKINLSYSKE
jgi:hypothetical protein